MLSTCNLLARSSPLWIGVIALHELQACGKHDRLYSCKEQSATCPVFANSSCKLVTAPATDEAQTLTTNPWANVRPVSATMWSYPANTTHLANV